MTTYKPVAFGCGVACIVVRWGTVLLGRRVNTTFAGQWAHPGGHVELGESAEEAAVRELLEETGLVGDGAQAHAPTITYLNKPFVGIPVTFLQAKGTLQPDHKFDALQFFDFDHLPEPLFEPTRLHMPIARELWHSGRTV